MFLPPWNGADLPKAITIMDEIEQHVLLLASGGAATAAPTARATPTSSATESPTPTG